MKFILGTKEGMTQIFDENGTAHAVTVLRALPATVTALRDAQKDGYAAVQVAAGEQKETRLNKAHKGKFGTKKMVKEFRPNAVKGETLAEYAEGAVLGADTFVVGDVVAVSAVSKGKGFQGVVKRHGFAGDKASHGRKHTMRAPGSIGGGGRAGGRVIKGMRMAGRMGSDRVTVKNLTVLQVNNDAHVILIKGAIPGRKGTVVEVRSA